MKKITITLLFFFTLSVAKSQTPDSTKLLEKEISSYQNNDLQFISNARLIIANALLKEDLSKTTATFNLLTEKYAFSKYLPFSFEERYHLSLITQQFGIILTEFSKYSAGIKPLNNKINAFLDDGLRKIVSDYFLRNENQIQKNIQSNQFLKNDDKDFLMLIQTPNIIAKSFEERMKQQELLNEQADDFIQKYPESVYLPFVQSKIKEELTDGNTAFQFDIYAGQFFTPSSFLKYFNDTDLIGGGLGIHIVHKKMIFSIAINTKSGFQRTNETLTTNGNLWGKDIDASILNVEFGTGYNISKSTKWKVYPYGAFLINAISPKLENGNKNPDWDKYRTSGVGIGLGAIVDYQISKGKIKPNTWLYGELGRNNFLIRFKSMLALPFDTNKPPITTYTYLNLGICWELRGIKIK
jgi:hypothetical protein